MIRDIRTAALKLCAGRNKENVTPAIWQLIEQIIKLNIKL